jgi:hypothetical protein
MFFCGRTLPAVEWRRFELCLVGDDPAPNDRAWRRPWAPLLYDVEQDPREQVDIARNDLWVLAPALRQVYQLLFSPKGEGD